VLSHLGVLERTGLGHQFLCNLPVCREGIPERKRKTTTGKAMLWGDHGAFSKY